MSIETLTAARELLRDLTPLKSNCGRICGGACCQPDPEEEKLKTLRHELRHYRLGHLRFEKSIAEMEAEADCE